MKFIIDLNNNYFPGLTSIRAIAALMVYLHHFNPFYKNQTFLGIPIWGITKELHIGVTIFFVLSGFLITLRYFEKEVDFKRFLWNRITRIYPVYFLITFLSFLYEVLESGFTLSLLKVFLLNITFLRGFFDSLKFTLVAQGWSLTVEEMFYILAPVIFYLIIKYGKKMLILIPIFLSMLGWLIGYFSIKFDWNFWGDNYFTFHYTFLGRSFEFMWGIFLALLFRKGNLYALKKVGNPYLGIFMAVFAGYLLHKIGIANNKEFGNMSFIGTIINTILIPLLVMTPLILSFTINQNQYQFFESKIFEIIGKSSYSFYLIHMGIIREILYFLGLKSELHLFFTLLILSILIWRFFEEPSQKLLKSFVSNNK